MARNHEEPRWVKFGRWLREERLKIISPTSGRPASQDELAARADLSRGQWARMELGGSGTQFSTIPRIARALGRTTESEIAEVFQRAGFASAQEPFNLPHSMRHFIDLPQEMQRDIARQVDNLYNALQEAKTKKRGK